MVSSPTVLDSSCVLLVGTSEWLTQFKATLNTRTDATVKRVETKSEALEVFEGSLRTVSSPSTRLQRQPDLTCSRRSAPKLLYFQC